MLVSSLWCLRRSRLLRPNGLTLAAAAGRYACVGRTPGMSCSVGPIDASVRMRTSQASHDPRPSAPLSHDFDVTDLDDWLNICVIHHIALKERRMWIEGCEKVFKR